MGGRNRFRCKKCGVEIEGKLGADGRIRGYDRAGYDGSPVQDCICSGCGGAGPLGFVPPYEPRPFSEEK